MTKGDGDLAESDDTEGAVVTRVKGSLHLFFKGLERGVGDHDTRLARDLASVLVKTARLKAVRTVPSGRFARDLE